MRSNNVLPAASSGLESPVSHGPGPPGPFSGVYDNDVFNDTFDDFDFQSTSPSSSPRSEYSPLDEVNETIERFNETIERFNETIERLRETVPFNFVTYPEEVKEVMDKLIDAAKPGIILAFDFSNGQRVAQEPSSGNLNLHASTETQSNSTKEAVTILAKYTKELFEAVLCFGFGDVTTLGHHVFGFFDDQRHCNGIEEILRMHCHFAQHAKKGQSISLVPIIHAAMDIVDRSGDQHHILIIFTGMAMQLK
jgi:hypothetical protein